MKNLFTFTPEPFSNGTSIRRSQETFLGNPLDESSNHWDEEMVGERGKRKRGGFRRSRPTRPTKRPRFSIPRTTSPKRPLRPLYPKPRPPIIRRPPALRWPRPLQPLFPPIYPPYPWPPVLSPLEPPPPPLQQATEAATHKVLKHCQAQKFASTLLFLTDLPLGVRS